MARPKRKAKQEEVPQNEIVTYKFFFETALSKGLVRKEQYFEIQKFFESHKLSPKEPIDVFFEYLSHY